MCGLSWKDARNAHIEYVAKRLRAHIAERVRAQRLAHGYTYTDVSALMGVRSGFGCDIERKHKGCTIYTLMRLAVIYDKEVASFLPTKRQMAEWIDEAEREFKTKLADSRKLALAGLTVLRAKAQEERDYGASSEAQG